MPQGPYTLGFDKVWCTELATFFVLTLRMSNKTTAHQNKSWLLLLWQFKIFLLDKWAISYYLIKRFQCFVSVVLVSVYEQIKPLNSEVCRNNIIISNINACVWSLVCFLLHIENDFQSFSVFLRFSNIHVCCSLCLFVFSPHSLFGVTGNCAACSKLIPAFEMVMRAKENVYHLDCFACQLCNQRWATSPASPRPSPSQWELGFRKLHRPQRRPVASTVWHSVGWGGEALQSHQLLTLRNLLLFLALTLWKVAQAF